MQLLCFSKCLKDKDVAGLIDLAKDLGLDGYDLCVRDGYVASPDNARQVLPALVKQMAAEGLSIPMVTGPTDLIRPEHPAAEPLMAAMTESGIRLLKIGYARCRPQAGDDYWQKVNEFRRALEGWAKLAEKHGVKVCYHTHSGPDFLGGNCAALMHLLQGFDPRHLGAYIDPGHLTVDGEPFALGLAMVREYLSIVALKDVLPTPQRSGDEGVDARRWVTAGSGIVAWSEVFAELVRIGYDGPLSVHAEYEHEGPEDLRAKLKPEVEYFRKKRDAALAAGARA